MRLPKGRRMEHSAAPWVACIDGCDFSITSVDELRSAVPRFSTVAFTCVVALVVTGTVQSWRQLGSLDALTSTNYGRVLLLKQWRLDPKRPTGPDVGNHSQHPDFAPVCGRARARCRQIEPAAQPS